jgi:hypothetical protein
MNSTNTFEISNPTNATTTTNEEDPYHYLHKISYAWYTMIGWAVVMIVGSVVNIKLNLKNARPF